MLSGESSIDLFRLSLKLSNVSPGRPAIRSMLILSKPASRAFRKALTVSWAVCCLPIILSTSSLNVWGFTEILEAPPSLITLSLAGVIVSARPASTLYSLTLLRSKFAETESIITLSWDALIEVGVPPPMYIVSIPSLSLLVICDIISSSLERSLI